MGKKASKYQVDIFIEKVELNIKFPCQLSILLKRGFQSFFQNHLFLRTSQERNRKIPYEYNHWERDL